MDMREGDNRDTLRLLKRKGLSKRLLADYGFFRASHSKLTL